MVGVNLNKNKVDADLADLALTMQRFMLLAERLNIFCTITSDAVFTSLGYSTNNAFGVNEVATLKSACHDADQVRQAIMNLITLPKADYTLNVNQLAGDLLP